MMNNPNAVLALSVPNNTNVNGATSLVNPENFYPKLWHIEDSDDAGTLSVSALCERQGVKCSVLKPNTEIKFFVRPKVLVQTYSTAILTGFANVNGVEGKSLWLDIATGYNVPHYGLKMAIDNCGYGFPITGAPQF